MPFKKGTRVTVKAGVSPCCDEGSLQHMALKGHPAGTGVSREHLVGKKGEVEEIREGPEGMEYLVDDQLQTGKDGKQERVGSCTMREWFSESDLEAG